MKKIKIPKGILLDLDNTLYNYQPCHLSGLEASADIFYACSGIQKEKFFHLYEECKREINLQLQGTASSHNRLLYFQRLFEKVKLPFDACLLLDLFEAYWQAFIQQIKLYDGVTTFLEECSKKRVKIAIVTDLLANIQIKKIAVLGIDRYIDVLVTSEEAGGEKPRAQLFLLALHKLALFPYSVWVIGDAPDKDISGGNFIGATTILFDPHNTAKIDLLKNEKADYIVHRFIELVEILQGMESDG